MPKTVLITGAGSGFGRTAAGMLASRGHKVIATVLNDEQAADLRRAEPKLTVAKLDITTAVGGHMARLHGPRLHEAMTILRTLPSAPMAPSTRNAASQRSR